ncbi:rod-binding protein [Rhodovulum adriaticum]|uniref:Rod binding protein n=1 Tax=Rhodovulum adriaticum TaxID=35804 RepID=A0A4R2NZC6_RHOAD|nr:rod-binding protein [Rhodovulum adriaticum]MBK1634756.1 chemotaxis protein chel [Rhodovulum adriaticum]TCP27669.1 rod binding protein [Rhodovulum adriaticum]
MITPPTAPSPRPPDAALRAAARQMETLFLAEMLDAAGLDAAPGAFGGGAGEAQFASFLRQEHAAAMTRQGGIGLAEALFEAMKARIDEPR